LDILLVGMLRQLSLLAKEGYLEVCECIPKSYGQLHHTTVYWKDLSLRLRDNRLRSEYCAITAMAVDDRMGAKDSRKYVSVFKIITLVYNVLSLLRCQLPLFNIKSIEFTRACQLAARATLQTFRTLTPLNPAIYEALFTDGEVSARCKRPSQCLASVLPGKCCHGHIPTELRWDFLLLHQHQRILVIGMSCDHHLTIT
jgi:hypothetical protein